MIWHQWVKSKVQTGKKDTGAQWKLNEKEMPNN